MKTHGRKRRVKSMVGEKRKRAARKLRVGSPAREQASRRLVTGEA